MRVFADLELERRCAPFSSSMVLMTTLAPYRLATDRSLQKRGRRLHNRRIENAFATRVASPLPSSPTSGIKHQWQLYAATRREASSHIHFAIAPDKVDVYIKNGRLRAPVLRQ
jgi:hypothetical protein